MTDGAKALAKARRKVRSISSKIPALRAAGMRQSADRLLSQTRVIINRYPELAPDAGMPTTVRTQPENRANRRLERIFARKSPAAEAA